MLNLFRSDPLKKLEKTIAAKLAQARDAQRSGNMPRYAVLSAEVEDLGRQLDSLRRDR
ncbi:MAG: DUF6435 family protein [Thermoanaerobaculia bacterium]|nr:DUF6435 family protein [Thermoanaerobaculia bacterium]